MGYWDRILEYVRGGPQAIDGWPDPIPISEFDDAVRGALGPALEREGFELVAARRWVRSSRQPIRDIVLVAAMKGIAYCPEWGFSIDFVPHVSGGGRVRWHRTAKSARFDLVYRPIDYAPTPADNRAWGMSPIATREELADDVTRVSRPTLAQALPFLDAVRSVADLPVLYAAHRTRPAVGLPFGGFPQQYLAHAFVLARLGQPGGETALNEYLEADEVGPEAATRLRELLERTADDSRSGGT